MRSIKPGRGPSMMGGVGAVFAAIFGVIWTIAAISMGAGFMGIFGIFFIGIAVFQAVFHFKNATNKNRYSSYDIVDSEEELDPLNMQFSDTEKASKTVTSGDGYCPYCGGPMLSDFEYCPKCGKRRP